MFISIFGKCIKEIVIEPPQALTKIKKEKKDFNEIELAKPNLTFFVKVRFKSLRERGSVPARSVKKFKIYCLKT